MAFAQSVSAQLPVKPKPATPEAIKAWQSLASADLAFLEDLIHRDYIYANYPGGAAWDAQLGQSLAQAHREVALVRDFDGYRAVLVHFITSFGDAHFSAYFNVRSQAARWPGFAVRYSGGRYVVASSSIPDVALGDQVESCDGRSLNAWMDTLSKFDGGPFGRETTHAAIAKEFLVDHGNPLYALPKACRVGGREVKLVWRPMSGEIASRDRSGGAVETVGDEDLKVSSFGSNGAWVRIGTMYVTNRKQAADFQKLIDEAPGLRDKDVVVIDVRGNAGGTYNWFMAFLRAYYGADYADYFARARLEITNVVMTPPGESDDDPSDSTDEEATIQEPPDPPMDVHGEPPRISKLKNGGQLIVIPAPVSAIHYPPTPPTSKAKAKVYVLADYGCASACLSFVDEMMRFPSVTLVGAETHVDRRSGGWPTGYELPSGLAVIRMGRMVRDGRARGDNEAWAPGDRYRYPGDIADTDGVKHWLLNGDSGGPECWSVAANGYSKGAAISPSRAKHVPARRRDMGRQLSTFDAGSKTLRPYYTWPCCIFYFDVSFRAVNLGEQCGQNLECCRATTQGVCTCD